MSNEQAEPKSKTKTKPRTPGRVIWTIIKFALLMFVGMGIAGAAWGADYAYKAYKDLPPYGNIDMSQSSIVYDRNGKELYKLHGTENRTFVDSKDIPQVMQDAIVAVEDYRFYQHHGVDFWRIAGAAFNDLKHLGHGGLQGASTITQQLARGAWLSQDQTLKRKVQEAEIAMQIERIYTKQEILKMYLNQTYFGDGAYGIMAASQTFFGKAPKDLTLPEAALIAGLAQSPSAYAPYENPEKAVARRNIVLGQMLKYGYINQQQYDDAKATTLKLAGNTTKSQQDPASRNPNDFTGASFVDYVIRMLTEPDVAKRYGITAVSEEDLLRQGYKIYTTLDPQTQKTLDNAITTQMKASDTNPDYLPVEKQNSSNLSVRPQAAGVVMDPKTGEVLAMSGGRTHEAMRTLNRATDTFRQPGSAIKPMVDYGPAIQELGWGTRTVVDDAPPQLTYPDQSEPWPQDYELSTGGRYKGLVPLNYALYDSRNAPAVRALQAVGLNKATGLYKGFEYGQKFGLSTLDPGSDNNASLALGGITKGVTLLDMTGAYSAIANYGEHIDPVLITKIVDANGQVIYTATPQRQPVLSKASDYILVDMMKDTIKVGTAAGYTGGGTFPYPAAGKTGTTEIGQDAWFLGFTTDRVMGIWTGYDQQKHLPWTGAFVPVQIWNQAMRDLIKANGAPADWQRPAGVVSAEVCKISGMLPTQLCPEKTWGLWPAASVPNQPDNVLVSAQAVKEPMTDKSGKPITSNGKPVSKWVLWQPGCAGIPTNQLFIRRPDKYALHPTRPWDEHWLPEDYTMELPTTMCTPAPIIGGSGTGSPSGSGGGGGTGSGSGPGGIFPPGYVPPVIGGGTDSGNGTGTPGGTTTTPGTPGSGTSGGTTQPSTPGTSGGTPTGGTGGH